MRSTVVFSVALLSAFYLEGRLSASECAARAPSTASSVSQDVIIGVKGVGSPRVLAVLPWGECGVACEVPGNTALAKPPDCLFAPRTTRD